LRRALHARRTCTLASTTSPHGPEAQVDRIRVLIADDEQIVRESLASVIGSDPSFEIVGSAEDAQGAIDLAAWRLPDVALLDVRMPGGGPRAAAEIARLSPSTRVLALSAAEDRESVLTMIRAGALSYVGKTASNEEILDAIHGTAEGGTQLSPRAVNGVFEAIADTAKGDGSSNGNGSSLGSDPREQVERIIERRAVELAYQPLADLATLRVVAAEALPRFRTRPMRSPESWLGEAAKHGWLIDLELVALNAALGHVGMLPSDAFLAVSISPETAVSGRFRDLIRGADQSRIALVLNEYSADHDELPTGALDELRADGVRVAIHHAGSGPGSLRHIVRLAPDLIKVDMSTLREMSADPTSREPVSSFIGFAFDIGAMVVADGVETEHEVETLRRLGIDHAQGNYLARPGPIPKGGGAWGRTTLSADPTAIAT
jgi:EAL domain-containing protein (putative c-di-GMP-specific phosphodiesterase class I)/DNA-binding NarL/FixJ family response regulator